MMIHYISIPQYQVYDNTLYSLYAGNFFKAERPLPQHWNKWIESVANVSSFALLYHRSKQNIGKRVFEYRLNQVVLNKVCRLRVRHTLFKNA